MLTGNCKWAGSRRRAGSMHGVIIGGAGPGGGKARVLQDKANPFGAIISSAMLLRYGLGEEAAARRIEVVVLKTLDRGFRTGGIYSHGKVLVGCKRIGEEVLKYVYSQELEVAVVGSM